MRTHRITFLSIVAAFLVLAVPAVGCGGESDDATTPSTPTAAEFPPTKGQTLAELAETIPASKLVAAPSQLVFEQGSNRYAFGVFTLGRKLVNDAKVALYFAPGADGKAIGPFPANVESLETPPAYQALGSSTGEPEVAYVVPDVDLDRAGEWQIIAVFKTADGIAGTRLASLVVGKFPEIPAAGEMPPRIHTQTADDVGGDLEKIDTRNPPDRMHEVDFADVIGRKPVALQFATPAFCESRLCGPVVDIAEQVREETGEEVAFIHQEVFNDNDPGKGVRRELRAFHLETEPWMFVFDAEGKVSSRFEGAFSAEELRAAVRKAQE